VERSKATAHHYSVLRSSRHLNLKADVMQRHKTLLVILLGFFALLGCASAGQAAERKAARTTAPAAGEHKVILLRKRATARGHFPKRGGYSYGRSDVIGIYESWRAPYARVDQSPGGPFDSGFFFDSGLTLLNNAPYPK
jgi:hypothetical protein